MGILDDAIREHLELKRQHGAAQSDLERLEHEAFGPAARPGDPGYETGESPVLETEGSGADEAPTTVTPAPGSEDPPEAADDAPPVDESASDVEPVEAPEAGIFNLESGELDVESMSTEDFAAAASGGGEPTPAERARLEHAHLDDTIDHPAPEAKSLSEELEEVAPPVAEPDAGEEVPEKPNEEESNAADDASLSPEPSDQATSGEEESPTPLTDPDAEEDEAPQPVETREGSEEGEASDEGSDEDSEDDADLLEETPEFLKDAPEGEDLWFEQGPPKDFDFD